MHDVLKNPFATQARICGPRMLFAVFQTGSKANGGVKSISAVIEGLHQWPRLVVTNRETSVCDRWRATGAEVIVWNLPYEMGSSARKGGLGTMLRRVASLIRTNLQTALWALRGKMTVIHCNDPAPFWHLAPAAKLMGIPLVFNLRDTKSPEEGLDVAAYRRRFSLTSRVLVISKEMKNFYGRVLSPESKRQETICTIYSSVDFSQMRPLDLMNRATLRAKLCIPAKVFAIGFVATFNDKKNQLDYIRHGVAKLSQVCPDARTYFVGDFDILTDKYAGECEAAALELPINTVNFVGYTPKVEEWYQACDLLVVPTRKEGLARCMIEGLACGTPVVSFDVCSAKEILEKHECGLVVSSGDYSGLVDSIRRLIHEAETLEAMKYRAIKTARTHFTHERMIREYTRLYRSLERRTK